MLKIQENILLKDFNTFKIGGPARYFAVVKSDEDLMEALAFSRTRKLPLFILGGGSNLLISDHGFVGLILKNEIKGIKFIDQENDQVILEVGAGEILDEVMGLSVIRKLAGLENLSGVPGTVGGAVVQNAGAYGMEIKDHLVSVAGFNLTNGKEFIFKKKDCQFSYRSSLFKKNKKFIITTINFELSKKPLFNLDYAGLKNKFVNVAEINPAKIRDAVLQIRAEKLPDWHKIGTAGSFFKNPVIGAEKYAELKEKYENIPGFSDIGEKVKVPLAWILDNICHLKGYQEGKVNLYEKQPIILVNSGGATASEIINFASKIKNIVKEKTGIEIEYEVEIIH